MTPDNHADHSTSDLLAYWLGELDEASADSVEEQVRTTAAHSHQHPHATRPLERDARQAAHDLTG